MCVLPCRCWEAAGDLRVMTSGGGGSQGCPVSDLPAGLGGECPPPGSCDDSTQSRWSPAAVTHGHFRREAHMQGGKRLLRGFSPCPHLWPPARAHSDGQADDRGSEGLMSSGGKLCSLYPAARAVVGAGWLPGSAASASASRHVPQEAGRQKLGSQGNGHAPGWPT